MEREAAIEALEAIENGMCRVRDSGDIWQDKLVYALCQASRLLLTDAVKQERRKKRYDWAFATDKSEVGENCKQLRKRLGMTAAELSERAGIATNAVYLLESGKCNTGLESLLLIGQALGCTPNDLLSVPEVSE